jgi:hypothetical protein
MMNKLRYHIQLLCGAVLAFACAASHGAPPSCEASLLPADALTMRLVLPAPSKPVLPPLFDDIERRAFDFFWDTTNPRNGMTPDRYPNPDKTFASIASIGFALTAYPVGVERAYISRAQARERVVTTLRFFNDAPQGKQATGTTGYKGFFYHFLDAKNGLRQGRTELSTVDTSLLLAGMLFVQSYFDGADPQEAEIRRLVDRIYARIDWKWAQRRAPLISMGFEPEKGFIAHDWEGYNEAMLVYILALGAPPKQAIAPQAWRAWTRNYQQNWGSFMGYEHLGFAPLFGHQYSHVWIDFRGIQDSFMRTKGIDYFENSRRATYAQRGYALANPGHWKGYGANVWGLTASDGPGSMVRPDHQDRQRCFRDYSARGAGAHGHFDDGTIAPTAALGALPFAPEIVIPAALEMHKSYGAAIYSTYGFLDAYNPSFTDATAQLSDGRVIAGQGWVASDYIGIDQGPILAMIANYRDELVWRTMRKNPYIVRGLRRAGFSGGWLASKACIPHQAGCPDA